MWALPRPQQWSVLEESGPHIHLVGQQAVFQGCELTCSLCLIAPWLTTTSKTKYKNKLSCDLVCELLELLLLLYTQDAKLAASRQEEDAWVKQQQETAANSSSTPDVSRPSTPADGAYHFICECFFMTAKALHLGIIKMIDDITDGGIYWSQIRLSDALQQAEAAAAR